MSTGLLRDLLKDIMEKDLLSLVMVITMDMDNLMSTRTVIIIMDLMDTRLSMIIGRDLLMLDMKEKVTSMSTDPTLTTQLRYTTQKLITATIKQKAEIVPKGFSFVLVKDIVHENKYGK